MSLPPELRTICHLLSSSEPSQLPYITPILLKNVMCCGEVLSGGDENAKGQDASESLVLVHKLKTQLTTLLTGKMPGGRFAAVVLIKAVVELGGWEILRGSESWVKGLLLVLAKPDAAEVKSICILTLARIYALTHQYQTLVREITTPTLPTFVTSCLNLVPKSTPTPSKALNGQETLVESVFEAFAALIPRHPTIFRPFSTQIQLAARLYLAPTMSDECFVPQSLRESACRVTVVLHQTAPKNSASDDWAKAVRLHIKASHATADQVFRAVVEDWESASGYVSEKVDINATLHGGSKSAEDFPEWKGIFAGVERLTGMLALLELYLKSSTTVAVSIPVDAILDLVTRMLSLAKPNGANHVSGSARINPAIDRNEREGLWAGLPRIHIASMQLLVSMTERLQAGFLPLSQICLDQITWLFPFAYLNEEFRTNAYLLIGRLLGCGGSMLPADSVAKLSPVVMSCCKDLLPAQAKGPETLSTQKEGAKNFNSNTSGSNADTFLRSNAISPMDSKQNISELVAAANELLPLFLSHLPQAHLGASLRFQIERTAIITHHQNAMINSVLVPFLDGSRTMPSILPHLSRLFPGVPAVESLLRPRVPPLPALRVDSELLNQENDLEEVVDAAGPHHDHMEADRLNGSPKPESPRQKSPAISEEGTTKSTAPKRPLSEMSKDVWGTALTAPVLKRGRHEVTEINVGVNETQPILDQNVPQDMEEDSDDESVPSLKMEFDDSSSEE